MLLDFYIHVLETGDAKAPADFIGCGFFITSCSIVGSYLNKLSFRKPRKNTSPITIFLKIDNLSSEPGE